MHFAAHSQPMFFSAATLYHIDMSLSIVLTHIFIFLLFGGAPHILPKAANNSTEEVFRQRRNKYMKATGIVRRIDDLGRVVIPKEIRRTMRIREGDPLEIYTDKDGEVIFKKYSPIGELSDFAAQICDSLHKSTDAIAAVCDRDTVIAISGGAKRELMDKRISAGLEHIIEGRSSYRFNGGSCIPVSDGEEKFCVSVAAPVVSEGDVMGCVLFICQNGGGACSDIEFTLAQTVASFLGKQMES